MSTTAFDDQFSADPTAPMSVPVHLELEPHVATRLKTLVHNLHTQDNRCTSHPVFEVRKDMAFLSEPQVCDECYWVDDAGERVTDPQLAEKLTAICHAQLEDTVELDGEKYREEFVQYAHETVGVFFTQAAADRFIHENQHNHHNSPRPLYVYISSGWKNPEWQLVRELLKTIGSALPSTK